MAGKFRKDGILWNNKGAILLIYEEFSQICVCRKYVLDHPRVPSTWLYML